MGQVDLRYTLDDGEGYQENVGGIYYKTTGYGQPNTWYVGKTFNIGLEAVSGEYTCLRGDIVTSAGEKLTSLSISLPFFRYGSAQAGSATIYAYLYDEDKTRLVSGGVVASGAIGSVVRNNVVIGGDPDYGASGYTNIVFEFNNLNVTGKKHFYIWLSSSDSSGRIRVLLSRYTMPMEVVNGTFTNPDPSVSWSVNTATTDNSVTLTIANLPAYTTVRVKYGSTGIESNTWGEAKSLHGIVYGPSQLKQWFTTAGVTTLKSITITASIDGYPLATASFTLTAGNNTNPTVGTPTVTIEQPARIQQTFPNTWIANISKAKVSVPAEAGSNAAISSVTVTYGSETMTLTYDSTINRYEGTTDKPVTGDTVFTATATDERGMLAQSSYSLTGVQAYTKPTVSIDRNRTYRCDSTGNEQSGGPYVRVQATMTFDTGIQGNTGEAFYFYVNEDGSGTTHNLSSGVQSAAFQLLSPRPDNAITIVVVAQDKISDPVSATITLSGGHRDFIVARYGAKTVVGIGQAPSVVKTGTGASCDGIDVAAGGGFYVGGKDTINYIGVGRRGTAVGTLWANNLLTVDVSSEKAAINESREFNLTASALSNWQNIPAAVLAADTRFRGIREVRIAGYYVVVIVIEIMPVAGRIWINQAAISTTLSWNGWKGHTPDIT